jgi:4-amino-4-deoxy-L-arabinose transferase-like glycosyltransferase
VTARSPSRNPLRAPRAQTPLWQLYPVFFAAVCLSHWTLLHLPYYWDEGGYYIPAAMDFYRTGAIIPHFTNAHPPLPNVLLGTLWHLVGTHVLATRIFVCAIAAAALLAVFRLTRDLIGTPAAVATTLLTGIYPIWFAQSTLAHADIFAAAFTLWAFALYLEAVNRAGASPPDSGPRTFSQPVISVALLFTLAALSKETAILQPAALAALEVVLLLRAWKSPRLRRAHAGWLAALSFPLLPLAAWYAYHHHVTGYTFGNPVYLRYNATANFNAAHILLTLRYRLQHLFWQRNIWVPLSLALSCLPLSKRPRDEAPRLSTALYGTIALLVAANWVAFSVLGGAPLTRYLLPIYPLLLLVSVATWSSRIRMWPLLAFITAAAFVSALWINPPFSFAPEDNLTYRDMIVVHQEAVSYLSAHYPDARVLTAWPVAADLVRPELGYTGHAFRTVPLDDFTSSLIARAAQHPDDFDTAIVFTTHFIPPELRRYLLSHSGSPRVAEFAANPVLTPEQIAAELGGCIVWQDDRNGEWAAILRFPRTKEQSACR